MGGINQPQMVYLSIYIYIRRPLQGGGRQRSRDIANLGGSLFRKFGSLWPCPILMHSLGDVWHPGPGVPCFGGPCFASLGAFGPGVFPILMHSLGDVWHPGPGVPCFGGFGGFCSLWGLTVSLSSLFFPILMHSLGDVWHPGPGVPCFAWGSLFRRFWRVLQPLGAHSLTFFPILPYLNAFLR